MSGFQQFLGNIKLDLASGTSTSDEESSGSSCYGDHSGLPMPTKEEYRDYESIMIECANESLRDTIRTVCAADIAHFTGINRRKGCWPLQPNELLK